MKNLFYGPIFYAMYFLCHFRRSVYLPPAKRQVASTVYISSAWQEAGGFAALYLLPPVKRQVVSPVYIYFRLPRGRWFRRSTYPSACKEAGGFAALHLLPPAKRQVASQVNISFRLPRGRWIRKYYISSACIVSYIVSLHNV